MKLVVIGFGQCGCRIADEFARLNKKAHGQRGIEVVTGAFAVNTDAADLSGLSSIRSDYRHRILIGGRKTGGHGVGKINELGAEIAKEDGDKVIDAVRGTRRLYESDAFLLIASAAGVREQAIEPLAEVLGRVESAYAAYVDAEREVAKAYKANEQQVEKSYKEVEQQANSTCEQAIAQALRVREGAEQQAEKAYQKAKEQAEETSRRTKEQTKRTYDENVRQALMVRQETIEQGWTTRTEAIERAWKIFSKEKK